MSELPPEVARLLAAERDAAGPSEAARERVQARVEATLGLAVGVGAAAGAAAATAATGKVAAATGKAAAVGWQAAMAHVVATKLAIVVAATGSVVGAGYFVTRAVVQHQRVRAHAAQYGGAAMQRALPRGPARDGEAASLSANAPDTIPSAPLELGDPVAAAPPPVAAPPAATSPVAAPPAATSPVAAPPVARPVAAPPVARHAAAPPVAVARHVAPVAAAVAHARRGGLSAERDLVAAARSALMAHDFDAALQAIDRHARLFPAGQLAEERDSLRVRVAAARGQHDRARALADDFDRAHPDSLFGPAVRAAASQ